MFNAILKSIQSLFAPVPNVPTLQVDDKYIGVLSTKEKYPSGATIQEMYYSGFLVEATANEWSLAIIVGDILAASYDISDNNLTKAVTDTARKTWNIKQTRSIDFQIDEYHIVRFHIQYFNDKSKLASWYVRKGLKFGSDAANNFIKRMG